MKKTILFGLPVGTLALVASASLSLAQTNQLPAALPLPAQVGAPAASDAKLQVFDLPLEVVGNVAAQLQVHYGNDKRIRITTEPGTGRLMILAPESIHQGLSQYINAVKDRTGSLATDARGNVVSPTIQNANYKLQKISGKQLEEAVKRLAGRNFTTVEVARGIVSLQMPTGSGVQELMRIDHSNNTVLVSGAPANVLAWSQVISAIDLGQADPARPTQLVPIAPATPERIEKAVRLVRFASFQNDQQPLTDEDGRRLENEQTTAILSNDDPNTGTGLIGDVDISFVNEMGIVILKGSKKDVERVKEVIEKIKAQSKETQPDIKLVELKHVNSQALELLIRDINTNVFTPRQGQVNITALVQPNALLLIGREDAMSGLLELINKLDAPLDPNSQPKVFKLLHTSSQDVEQLIRNFFSDTTTTGGANQGSSDRAGLSTRVKVLADYRTNSLIVQASPRDMIEVSALIKEIDVDTAPSESQIRIIPIKNTLASELQPVLAAAIGAQSTGGNAGQNQGNQTGAQGPTTNTTGGQARTPSGKLVLGKDANGNPIDSGILAGVVITSSPNVNALIVRAPAKSMPLIEALVTQLDSLPGADAKIKVFPVINGDATSLALTLQQVFGLPATAGTATTNTLAIGLQNLAALTGGGEGSVVPLRITTDARTNTIIASGSESDLGVIEAVLYRLDDAGSQQRTNQVVWLRNSAALDVANAINQLLTQQRQVITQTLASGQQISVFERADREVFIVAEPATNSLVISATPRYAPQIMSIIERIDRQQPMIAVEVLIAEVTLDDNFELGNEFGIQDSLLFKRGAATRGTLASPVFNVANVAATGAPLAATVSSDGNVAGQGLTGFGLGRSSAGLGYGGLVLAASNESVGMLFRALEDNNRLQILARPNLLTIDNNISVVKVGQLVPRVSATGGNQFGQQNVSVAEADVGLIMQIQPRTNQDGLINMIVAVNRSTLGPVESGIPVGFGPNGETIRSPIINQTLAQTRVTAYDGQTVVLGGLITKTRASRSRKVPWLGSIPIMGALFRFDSEQELRTELLVVMTPRVINANDAGKLEMIKQVESARMSWCMADILNIHGDAGLSPGNGLWGPAASPVIFPDLQPTAEYEETGRSLLNSDGIIGEPEPPFDMGGPDVPVQINSSRVKQDTPRSGASSSGSTVNSVSPYLGTAPTASSSVRPASYQPPGPAARVANR